MQKQNKTQVVEDEDDDDFGAYDEENDYCYTCHNSGVVIACWDDLCQDGCIHGDGEEPCPDCDGEY